MLWPVWKAEARYSIENCEETKKKIAQQGKRQEVESPQHLAKGILHHRNLLVLSRESPRYEGGKERSLHYEEPPKIRPAPLHVGLLLRLSGDMVGGGP